MKRIQVMLDDNLAAVMSENAARQGLSVSAFTRIILKNCFDKKHNISLLEQGLLDISNGDIEKVSPSQFKKDLETLKNA